MRNFFKDFLNDPKPILLAFAMFILSLGVIVIYGSCTSDVDGYHETAGQEPFVSAAADESIAKDSIDDSFRYIPDIPLSEELQSYTYGLCQKYGVDYLTVLAIMKAGSNFNADIVTASSDYGLMLINEICFEEYHEKYGIDNLLDPKQNIFVGVHILSRHLREFDTEWQALMAYQLGTTGAKAALDEGTASTTFAERVLAYKQYYYLKIYN